MTSLLHELPEIMVFRRACLKSREQATVRAPIKETSHDVGNYVGPYSIRPSANLGDSEGELKVPA